MAAPAIPQHRTLGQPGPANVGNGNDFLAQVTGGLISTVDGSFPFAYNDAQNPGEADSMYGANTFSAQINSNTFPSSLCGAKPYPNCRGWEQFVFSNFPAGQFFSGIYIQNWLLGATQPCPASWTYSSAGGGCFRNSTMTPITPVAITDLSQVTLTGSAQSVDNTDSVLLAVTTGGYQIIANEQDSIFNLSQNWSTAEFNVVGGGNGSEAVFNTYTVISPQMDVYITNGTVSCTESGTGFTGEFNNLNLIQPCIAGGSLGQSVEFFESNSSENPPAVSTGSASMISSTSAVLNGTVNPNMSAPFYWFQYSTSSGALNCSSAAASLTQPQAGTNLEINLPAPFTATITGLSGGTTYYYVGCALYSGGLVIGNVASFTTVQLVSDVMSMSTPSGSGCSAPAATTGFFTTNSQALIWFLVNNANAGDQITARWNNPAGSVYTTYSWSPPSSSGQWCFWDSIPIAGSPPASEPGIWNVSVSYNGSFLFTQSFTIQQPPPGLQFVAIAPCRVADTRDSSKPPGFGPPSLVSGGTRSFTIPSGSCSIPATAQAYALNVTVVPQGELGYLTVWPAGQDKPLVSTLNSLDGEVKANAAIVAAGTGGAISAFATNNTDLVLDINGYFVPVSDSTLAYYPVTPCRVVDTRAGAPQTILTGRLAANSTTALPILSSVCGVPPAAQAYSLNFTLAPPGPVGYLTAWPTGESRPIVSTLNDPTGTVEANAAIAPAGTGGNINVYVTDATDLVVDINGYFAPAATGALSLYALPPCRALDTRNPAGMAPFEGTINVNVLAAGCGGTTAAQAYLFNATVVPPGPLGYITLWPEGRAQPLASTLNAIDGAITSNMAIVPTSNTEISAFASNSTYLVLDLFGYFAP